MLRTALIVPAAAVEEVMDALVPLLPRGVHERAAGDGTVELAFYERPDALPPQAELEAAADGHVLRWESEEVPDDPLERRRRFGRAWEIAGRLRVRSPADPPGDGT